MESWRTTLCRVNPHRYCSHMAQDEPTKVIAARVRALRERRGWSGDVLARAMRAAGIPWERVVVAKLETGRRASVTVTELLALAYVLNVAPVHLIVPPDEPDATYRITDEVAESRSSVRAWIRGVTPLNPDSDPRQFYAEVPREEFYAVQQRRLTPEEAQRLGYTPEDGG